MEPCTPQPEAGKGKVGDADMSNGKGSHDPFVTSEEFDLKRKLPSHLHDCRFGSCVTRADVTASVLMDIRKAKAMGGNKGTGKAKDDDNGTGKANDKDDQATGKAKDKDDDKGTCKANDKDGTGTGKAKGTEKNFHLEVRDGERATVHSEAEKDRWRQYYQRHKERILSRHRAYYQLHKERILARKRAYYQRRRLIDQMMQRIRELHESAAKASLAQQRCKSSASRDALARLLAASDGSVGTSASASGSSEASSGSGGGVPSPAAAARRKGSTLQWPGDVPADAEGEPPSEKMKQAGPSEDDKQK